MLQKLQVSNSVYKNTFEMAIHAHEIIYMWSMNFTDDGEFQWNTENNCKQRNYIVRRK